MIRRERDEWLFKTDINLTTNLKIASCVSLSRRADNDEEVILSFDEQENDHLIFVASLECGDLCHALSYSVQAFQIWYLALYPDKIGHETQLVLTSKRVFPDLPAKTRQQQLVLGHAFLETVLSNKGIL